MTTPITPSVDSGAPSQEREKRINALIKDMDIAILFGESINDEIKENLTQYKDSTLSLLEDTVAWHTKTGIINRKFMVSATLEAPENVAREVLFYRPLIKVVPDETGDIFRTILGLHFIDRFKNVDQLEEMTGDDLAIAIAVLNVTTALLEYTDYDDSDELDFSQLYNGEMTTFIKDSRLQELLVERHQQSDIIIDYIRDRGTVDTKHLREYIDDHSVLKQGQL